MNFPRSLCLVFPPPSGQACLASSGVRGASNSLLHSVIKLAAHSITGYNSCSAAKMVNPHTEVLRAVFNLLANCALSAECRGVLKKVWGTSSCDLISRGQKLSLFLMQLCKIWVREVLHQVLTISAE